MPDLKLHWVSVEVGMYMLAESEEDAMEEAERMVQMGADGASLQSMAWEMSPSSTVPVARMVEPDWVNSYPFVPTLFKDEVEEKTVGELFGEVVGREFRRGFDEAVETTPEPELPFVESIPDEEFYGPSF